MQLTGTIKSIDPVESGTSKAGKAWSKRNFIIEYKSGNYDKKVQMAIMNDKANDFNYGIGSVVTVDFDVESREFNGKYYTNATAWKVVADGSQSNQAGGSDLPF